ncbi:MAG: sugar transferase [Actinobacteria bacterium]|nr:MAG: sugar transferase [Actinomycetota bacterium]
MLGRMAAKRLLDVVCATLLMLFLAPVLIVVVAAMTLSMLVAPRDRGAFLYREQRISQGRVFDLLKFRTLRADVLADMRGAGSHARLYEAEPANLTWAGRRMLKPWYLDELPQLVNVLRGDISLVGPRPWPPEMVERQVAEGLTYRNEVRAGLTGPAQVTKGSGLRFADLDLRYVDSLRRLGGLALVRYDLQILWATVRVIARGEGLSY